jgi:hypothetical protein
MCQSVKRGEVSEQTNVNEGIMNIIPDPVRSQERRFR